MTRDHRPETRSSLWTRRQLLETSVGALASALPLLGCRTASGSPDVLFIVADDLNDWIGCLGGHPQAKTPNIDRLAAEGILFAHNHCSSSACNPSRTSVMTGIPAVVHGLYGNGFTFRRFLPDAVTLPQHFMRHGYRTLGCGKVFHSTVDEPSWDDYFLPDVHWPDPRPGNGISRYFDWGPIDDDPIDVSDGQLVRWATKELSKPRRKPLFLAVGFNRPHLPWFVPREFYELFPYDQTQLPTVPENDLDDIPLAGKRLIRSPKDDHAAILGRGIWNQAASAYLANTLYLDWLVGELLKPFESRRGDGAIVVLWSDHGFHLGQKRHWRKRTLWREGTRVPMIVSAPGRVDPGQVCERPVTMTALGATLSDLCGLDEPWGQVPALTPLLADPASESSPPAIIGLGGHGALCAAGWRYIRYGDKSEELYDLTVDPLEWTNLAGSEEHQEIKAELSAQLPSGREVAAGNEDDLDN